MSNINAGTPDPILVTLGEVGFSRHWVVTPAGNAPIAGTTILITDLTRVERKIPTWAIVLAIIGFFFAFLGLLFLLVRETYVSGYFSITVQNGPLYFVTQVPAVRPDSAAEVHHLVGQARGLVAAAPPTA